MKNRTSLVLMEQLVMILVFALAAAVCLQIFVGAGRISQHTQQQDEAVLLAQNGAETVKALKGDLPEIAGTLGGTADDTSVLVEAEGLLMEITLLPEEMPGLGQANVQVTNRETALFSLTVGWQEVQ